MANEAIGAWLKEDVTKTADGRYWHRLLVESSAGKDAALTRLKSLVRAAHDDSRKYLLSAFGDSLDPLEETATSDFAASYPAMLALQTLYGYFGEILAGVSAETFGAFGLGPWVVPAYLFRFHVVAFQELERIRLGEPSKSALPGRTGDDCLAFIRDVGGTITATLVCEAKCTEDHDSGMIADAHVKVSEELRTPVDLIRLIQVLQDRGDTEGAAWVQALDLLPD